MRDHHLYFPRSLSPFRKLQLQLTQLHASVYSIFQFLCFRSDNSLPPYDSQVFLLLNEVTKQFLFQMNRSENFNYSFTVVSSIHIMALLRRVNGTILTSDRPQKNDRALQAKARMRFKASERCFRTQLHRADLTWLHCISGYRFSCEGNSLQIWIPPILCAHFGRIFFTR